MINIESLAICEGLVGLLTEFINTELALILVITNLSLMFSLFYLDNIMENKYNE
jgi:hypothetical protein